MEALGDLAPLRDAVEGRREHQEDNREDEEAETNEVDPFGGRRQRIEAVLERADELEAEEGLGAGHDDPELDHHLLHAIREARPGRADGHRP